MNSKQAEVNLKIMSSVADIATLTSEMIAVPSVTGQEGQMAEWVERWLNENGFKVKSYEIDPDFMEANYKKEFYRWAFPYSNRPNIVGVLKGTGNGKSLMLNFHLDVVDASAENWSVDPWKGTVKDNLLFGRGSSDMKGGAASALYAIKTIIDSGISLKGDLIVAGVIEEEGPGNGTFALQANGIKADACIIPEPTSLKLSIGVVGGIYGIIDVLGKSAHSTMPWHGVNAVEKGYLILNGLKKWRKYRRQVPLDKLLADEPETPAASHLISISRTDDGLMGKIPASAQLMVRSTVLPGEDPWELAKAFETYILDETKKDTWLEKKPPTFSWMRAGGRNYPAMLSENHPLCTQLADSYKKIIGENPRLTCLPSPADMQQLMNFSPVTPTLMFGPGSIYDAHTDDESVPVNDLVNASAVLADFILEWCGVS